MYNEYMITCTFEDNGKTSLRHVTVNAIVTKNNKILFGRRGLRNGKPISEYGKWGLLGGYFDRDETLVQALKREVREESGWEIDELVLMRINDKPNRPKEDRQNVDFIYIARAITQIGTGDEEVAELRWFDMESLPPPETIAFDHGEAIHMYREYLNNKVTLPIVG